MEKLDEIGVFSGLDLPEASRRVQCFASLCEMERSRRGGRSALRHQPGLGRLPCCLGPSSIKVWNCGLHVCLFISA